MKINFLAVVFVVFNTVSVYCGGLTENNLVNTREIELENVNGIDIVYTSENIAFFESDTDKFILKEYMSIDKSNYYARISYSGDKISIEKGNRPFGIGTGILFNTYNARIEIYLPRTYTKDIRIKTTSGKIEMAGEYSCSEINVESTSGNILVDNIAANNMIFKTTSGNIRCGSANGNTNFHTRSGSIRFQNTGGNISAETTSGNMRCTIIEAGGNISLAATSGTININLPAGFAFNFQSETLSGSLSTPFSENLFSSIANRKLVQGVIGNASGAIPDNDIKIKTISGSIKVKWI